MPFATPDTLHPLQLPDGSTHTGAVFLKPAIDHPRFEVGDYSYAFDRDPPADWAGRLAPYLYPFSPERLVLGKFCQLAHGTRFITASANHRYDGISSYPFALFDDGPKEGRASLPQKPGRDTVIGHDVWFGEGATVLPGASIGSGVIVGAGSVVSGHVPDYAIVAGNPARVVRMRFAADIVQRLLKVAWWDWPIDRIVQHEAAICDADTGALERAA